MRSLVNYERDATRVSLGTDPAYRSPPRDRAVELPDWEKLFARGTPHFSFIMLKCNYRGYSFYQRGQSIVFLVRSEEKKIG